MKIIRAKRKARKKLAAIKRHQKIIKSKLDPPTIEEIRKNRKLRKAKSRKLIKTLSIEKCNNCYTSTIPYHSKNLQNIVYLLWADDNQAATYHGAGVFLSILSVKQFVKNPSIHIYLSDRSRFSVYEKFWKEHNVRIVEMPKRKYSGYINTFMFFRKVLNDLDCFMYLDADMMFHRDLSKLGGYLKHPLLHAHHRGSGNRQIHDLHSMSPQQFSFLQSKFKIEKPYRYINGRFALVNQNNSKFWELYIQQFDLVINDFLKNISPKEYTKRKNTVFYTDELYFTLTMIRIGCVPYRHLIANKDLDSVIAHGIHREKRCKHAIHFFKQYMSVLTDYFGCKSCRYLGDFTHEITAR